MNKKVIQFLSLPLVFILAMCSSEVPVPEEETFELTNMGIVNIHTDFQQQFIDSEDSSQFCKDNQMQLGSFSISGPKATTFTWEAENEINSTPTKYVVSLSESNDMSNALSYETPYKSCDIYNLKINTQYYWTVTAYFNATPFVSDVSTFTTDSDGPRNIHVEGVENIRDLGGYPTESGKTFKQGLIYRSAQFNYDPNSSSAIISAPTGYGMHTLLNELHIKSEIDVRQRDNKGKDETAGLRSSALGPSVDYQYLPMKYGGANIFDQEVNRESLKAFFEYLSVEDHYPMVFHCVRGTDRTGALAYVLGALCGVSKEYLLKDYNFSNFAAIISMVYSSDFDEATSYYVKGIDNATGETISERAANYVMSKVDVSLETLNKIKSILLK